MFTELYGYLKDFLDRLSISSRLVIKRASDIFAKINFVKFIRLLQVFDQGLVHDPLAGTTSQTYGGLEMVAVQCFLIINEARALNGPSVYCLEGQKGCC